MNEKFYVLNLDTRKISLITEEQFRLYDPKAHIKLPFEKMYNEALLPGMHWTLEQGVHYLANENPNDIQWRVAHGIKTQEYHDIMQVINRELMLGNLVLKPINGTCAAENIIFIRIALANGFDIPEVFKGFAETYIGKPNSIEEASDFTAPIALGDNFMDLYKKGEKAKNAQQKASAAGAAVMKNKAQRTWKPLLDAALETAKANPKFYSAISLAKITLRKNNSSENPRTFSKKIFACDEIKSLLKRR